MKKNKHIYLDYDGYDWAIRMIAKRMKQFKFDGIYGIPSGGLIMAVHLHNLMGLPLLLTPTKNSLVVDDIADTGMTLQNIKHKKIATLYYHKQSKVIPDYWIYEKTDKWIVYWWEE